MLPIIASLLEGNEKLSGSRVGYGVLLSLAIAVLIAITWAYDDVLSNRVWYLVAYSVLALMLAMLCLAFMTRPPITEEDRTSQLAKAHTIGVSAPLIALFLIGPQGLERSFPNYVLIIALLQGVTFLVSIIIRTAMSRSAKETGVAVRHPMYLQLSVVTGALLLGMAVNLSSMESSVDGKDMIPVVNIPKDELPDFFPEKEREKGTRFRSESELLEGIGATRNQLHLDSIGTVISTALLDTLEQLSTMSQKARGAAIVRMKRYVDEIPKDKALEPLVDIMTNSVNYFANEERIQRYRQLAICFGFLWCACWSFWVLRLVLRMKVKADFTGI